MGFIFAILDVEDFAKAHNRFVLYLVLTKEITFCEPIGLVFGIFGGFMCEFIRQMEARQRKEAEQADEEEGRDSEEG